MEYISILKEDVDLNQQHRYLRLPHPRTGLPQLYLSYKSSIPGGEGLVEVVKINCAHRRTWFIGETGIDGGSILMHVPVDPLFLVIPIILSLLDSSSGANQFQPLTDLIAQASVNPTFALPEPFSKEPKKGGGWNEDVARLLSVKAVRRVFKACCEKKVVPAAPPSPSSESGPSSLSEQKGQAYYRPSRQLILQHLTKKVEHLSNPEQFEKFDHLVRALGRDGLLDPNADPELARLTRVKSSIEHLGQYLPPSLPSLLLEVYDFTPLNTYLANRTAAQIAASAPISQSKSDPALKGGVKRKAQGSRGVESLKKVNTSSMAKMTSFFKPKEAKK